MWMSMNGSCQERHLLVSKSFCKMKRLLISWFRPPSTLSRNRETSSDMIHKYSYITFNCIFIYKKVLWVALTPSSTSSPSSQKKASYECRPQRASPTKTWHLWTSGHLTPFDHPPQWFHIFQPLNLDAFWLIKPWWKGHRVSCLCQVSWVQCVSWHPNDCIREVFFSRFSMEKLIGVGSCCLRLQDEGEGGWGGKTFVFGHLHCIWYIN